jgi:hypothetical protein
MRYGESCWTKNRPMDVPMEQLWVCHSRNGQSVSGSRETQVSITSTIAYIDTYKQTCSLSLLRRLVYMIVLCSNPTKTPIDACRKIVKGFGTELTSVAIQVGGRNAQIFRSTTVPLDYDRSHAEGQDAGRILQCCRCGCGAAIFCSGRHRRLGTVSHIIDTCTCIKCGIRYLRLRPSSSSTWKEA